MDGRPLFFCDKASRPISGRFSLALTRLEATIGLVDDVSTATTTDHAAVPVTILEALERIANLHDRACPFLLFLIVS
jgi:hypothetical protein